MENKRKNNMPTKATREAKILAGSGRFPTKRLEDLAMLRCYVENIGNNPKGFVEKYELPFVLKDEPDKRIQVFYKLLVKAIYQELRREDLTDIQICYLILGLDFLEALGRDKNGVYQIKGVSRRAKDIFEIYKYVRYFHESEITLTNQQQSSIYYGKKFVTVIKNL